MGRGTGTGVTGEDIARAYDARGPGETLEDVARRLGENPNTARRKKSQYDRAHEGGQRPPSGERVRFEERDGAAEATSESPRIRTLEQLLAACNVDLDVWQVDRYVVNVWEVGANVDGQVRVEPLYQVKAWLKRRADAATVDVLAGLLEQVRAAAPVVRKPRAVTWAAGEYLLVPALFDLHVGKRSADNTYTLKRAADDFEAVADTLLARVRALGVPVERIMFPVGNDALHADTLAGTTTKGTAVETSADPREAMRAALYAYIHVIERLAELAPVDAIVIAGNHDRTLGHALGLALEARFHRDARVRFDTANQPRKFYRYGSTLLGLTHGDGVKPNALPALMAVECPPELWVGSEHREWLQGHVHHSAQMFFLLSGDKGITARSIPALCPPDTWHVWQGYIGSKRAGEVLLYHRERGPDISFPVFVDEPPPHDLDKHASPPQHAGERPDGAGGQHG